MGFPFGNPFSPFAPSDEPDHGLGEPVMPHFLGLDDPFGDPFGSDHM